MGTRRGERRSRVAAAASAVRRHRRSLSRPGEAPVGVRTAAVVAIREADPHTLTGVVVQGTAIATVSGSVWAWRHRVALAPVAATGMVLPWSVWMPTQTATGLAACGLAGLLASQAPRERIGEQAASRRRGLAWWAGGVLVWMGAGAVGGHEALAWWADLIALGAAVSPGAWAWWRQTGPMVLPPVPAGELEPGSMLPAAAVILGETLEAICAQDRSPIQGGRVMRVACPATNVATAVVDLPDGLHSSKLDQGLQSGLEAYLDRRGRGVLGGMEVGAVKIEPAGIGAIKVTASWSRALDEEILAWRPPADLGEGRSWIGLDDAREDMVLESWSRGADGRVSVHHVWAIGRTGGGKSTTIRALVAPDLVGGREVLIPVDGKGTMGKDLIPFSLTGGIAKGPDAARQAVTLAYTIFLARQARLDGENPWMGPTPTDPIVALFIDEYSTIGGYLTKAEVTMVCEMARMARDLGVRIVQSGQIPLVDSLIGGSEYRSQCRIVLGHGILDAVHDRIATQSGGADGPSLLGMPTGRAVVLVDGHLVANRAKVAYVTDRDLADLAAPRATLHPDDLTDEVTTLLRICASWGTSRPAPVVDIRGLLSEWTDDTTTDATDAAETGGGRAGTVTPITSRPAASAQADGLRQLILGYLLTHPTATRPELVTHAQTGGYSKSGTYKAINQLVAAEQVVETAGQISAALWAEAAR